MNTSLERSYAASKRSFWDEDRVFDGLIAEHGEIRLRDEQQAALRKIFSVIYYGEVAATEVAAQLVCLVPDPEVRPVLAAQVFEEAKHARVLARYLRALGGDLPPVNLFAKRVLCGIRSTNNPWLKLLGMQLFVENLAHHLFRELEQTIDEPVLCGLLRYIDEDEVKHVGLARNYLPRVLQHLSVLEASSIFVRLGVWSVQIAAAARQLEPAACALGIDMIEATKNCARDHRKLLLGLGRPFWSFAAERMLAENVVDWFAERLYVSA